MDTRHDTEPLYATLQIGPNFPWLSQEMSTIVQSVFPAEDDYSAYIASGTSGEKHHYTNQLLSFDDLKPRTGVKKMASELLYRTVIHESIT